ncbi:nuclear pore complex component [Plectosphaerella plurivora]|uniref:Nuclear pore complex component n=1 Tax=Plectosphaerella plurivora TaxID=936078 RepID=A0A9P8VBQ4_9PEZI|nr:nuclear pore complex component [Plectosphaerella plurivora]
MNAVTPVKATPQKAPPVTDSPGTWRHPRLDEITRRRDATTFSEKNVRKIATNVSFLLALWLARAVVSSYLSPQLVAASTRTYLVWAYYLLQAPPLANMALALLPLFRARDDLDDIPLSSAQRKLLGLPPSSRPATPNAAVYSTPPRYSRTPSVGGSVASNRSYNSSPLSGKGSPAPYSPSASPSKFLGSLGSSGRRSSFGTSTSLGAGPAAASSLFSDSASPSPSAGKRTSVGLNNKWLYERGRRSSSGAFAPLR